MMRPIDYERAVFVTLPPGYQVRFAVESGTRIIDEESGYCEDFLQAASCKRERFCVKRNVFRAANYDFLPLVGPAGLAIFRRKD